MEIEWEKMEKKRKRTYQEEEYELSLEEESKKKIYLHSQSCGTFRSCSGWFMADPYSSTSLEKANVMMNSMPMILQHTHGYATALLETKLYFLGGQIWDKLIPYVKESVENIRNTVFAFDVATQTWDDPSEYPSLQSPRHLSRAVAVDDKIFVFGTCDNYQFLKDVEHYAEYLDLSISNSKEERKWNYIHNSPRELFRKSYIHSIAVCKKHILFWADPHGCLYMLDYQSLKWQTVDLILGYLPQLSFINEKIRPILGPRWSNTVVVWDDALFWHYGSKIYAYDFTNSNPQVLELCNFNYPLFLNLANKIAKGSVWTDFPPTYLVSHGNGKLCLIWEGYIDEPIRFYCQNFHIQRKNDATLVASPGSLTNFDSHPEFLNVLDLYLM